MYKVLYGYFNINLLKLRLIILKVHFDYVFSSVNCPCLLRIFLLERLCSYQTAIALYKQKVI